MESLQGSWQYENIFSSAKEISPPISPVPLSPPSPTLYSLNTSIGEDLEFSSDVISGIETDGFNGGNEIINTRSPFLKIDGGNPLLSATPITFMQPMVPKTSSFMPISNLQMNIASDLPTDLFDVKPTLDWNEPSMNLEGLFDDIDYPQSAQVTHVVDGIADNIGNHDNNVLTAAIAMSEESFALANQSSSSQKEKELDEGFQNILKELDIPSSIVVFEAEELEGEELGLLSDHALNDGDSSMDESSNDSDSSSSIGSSSPGSVQDQEIVIYSTDDSQGTQLIYYDNNIIATFQDTIHTSDSEDDAQEMAADALLRGDILSARTIYPSASFKSSRGSKRTKDPLISTIQNKGVVIAKSSQKGMIQPERRGRKPSSGTTGKNWVHLTDKVQRKKEQNKTAATRYRQKKKQETRMFLDQETELLGQKEDLLKRKESLGNEIRVMKQLLRDLFTK